jgi:hypothetical protein
MARDQNTFAKRHRELEKKRKAEAKLERRRQKRQAPEGSVSPPAKDTEEDTETKP